MNIENRNGAWIISDIINGYSVTRKYIFYTKKQAISAFKQEFNVKE